MAVIECGREELPIGMRQLDILRILGLKIGVARLVGVLVQEEKKGIQVLVGRAIDSTAIIECELIFVVYCIGQIGGGKEADIAARKARVSVDGHRLSVAQLMSVVIGVFRT